jgi:hypothetical protein
MDVTRRSSNLDPGGSRQHLAVVFDHVYADQPSTFRDVVTRTAPAADASQEATVPAIVQSVRRLVFERRQARRGGGTLTMQFCGREVWESTGRRILAIVT